MKLQRTITDISSIIIIITAINCIQLIYLTVICNNQTCMACFSQMSSSAQIYLARNSSQAPISVWKLVHVFKWNSGASYTRWHVYNNFISPRGWILTVLLWTLECPAVDGNECMHYVYVRMLMCATRFSHYGYTYRLKPHSSEVNISSVLFSLSH